MKNKEYLNFSTNLLVSKNMMYIPKMKDAVLESASLPYQFDEKLREIGYTLSDEAFKELFNVTDEVLGELYLSFMTGLAELLGLNVVYQPLNAEFAEWNEDTAKAKREIKEESLKEVAYATDNDVIDYFFNLLSAPKNWSSAEKNLVAKYFAVSQNAQAAIPEDIPQKENKMYLCKVFMHKDIPMSLLHMDTATDVLRFAVALSNGDISLAKKTRFKKFKSKERRTLLRMIKMVKAYGFYEDASRYPEQWKRLNEIIHLTSQKCEQGEYMKKICDGKLAQSFMGRVDAAYTEEDYGKVLELYAKRPGEFIRGLHRLLTNIDEKKAPKVLAQMVLSCDSVPVPTLLQLRTYFASYHDIDKRYIYPKGNAAKVMAIEAPKKLSEELCAKTVQAIDDLLIAKLSDKEPLGKVYISEEMKKHFMPLNSRSVSDTKRTFSRGSRIKIKEDTNILRSFIYWVGYDVDLSATLFDAELNNTDHISFTNLELTNNKEEQYANHSGDIRNAPKGASEFIDFDLDKLPNECKYIAFSVHVYSGKTFKEHETAFFGFMNRNKLNGKELYAPQDVQFKVDLNGEFYDETIVVYDVDNREFVWIDMPVSTNRRVSVCENSTTAFVSNMEAMLHMKRPSLYDLAYLNAKARGEIVDDKSEADIVFDIDEGLTPFDVNEIMTKCC